MDKTKRVEKQREFHELVHTWNRRALGMALGFTHNLEDAKEMVQEAYLKAYENLNRFRGEAKMSTWFTRILINTCLKQRRRLRFWRRETALQDLPEGTLKTNDHTDISLQQTLLRRKVTEVLKKLPPMQRKSFVLRYHGDHSLEEIGVILNVSRETVKTHLNRAMARVRNEVR